MPGGAAAGQPVRVLHCSDEAVMFERKRRAARHAVLATCPDTGEPVRTHAFMNATEFAAQSVHRLAFFCSACRGAHLADRAELRLDVPPLHDRR